MNPIPLSEDCDRLQEALAAALDEGRPLTAGQTAHLADCPDCRDFHAFWTRGAGLDLAAPLPGAGLMLRHTILSFPAEEAAAPAAAPAPAATATATATAPAPLRWPRHWLRIAAMVALCAIAGMMLNPRRADSPQMAKKDGSPGGALSRIMDRETLAMHDDLRDGMRAVTGPLAAFMAPLQP